jgi:bifunctional non-homologous end joining protein LigD
MSKQSTTLFYRQGSSDKVYQLQLEPKGALWVVNFQYGRRGSSLKAGTKTQEPVPLDKAQKIYNKIYNEKTGEGYTEGADGTAYAGTEKAGQVSGVLPQLLNEIDDATLELLLNNTTHCAQEKHDGKRTMVKRGETAEGVNKKGLLIPLCEPIKEAAEAVAPKFIADGEGIGDVLYAFDLLENEQDLRGKPYIERYQALSELLENNKSKAIRLVETAWTPKEKRALFEKLKKNKREGIVFKEINSTYQHGRPDSGGTQLKYKFYATASVYVVRINSKRSVGIAVFPNTKDLTRPVEVGNVTIPANQPIPTVGSVIETRYLYAYEGGSLFQPTCLGIRSDVDPEECLIRQLKYKSTDSDEE